MSLTSAIIGFGNLLMGDEGVGIHAIEHLRNSDTKIGADMLDGGTGGMALLHILEKYQHIIVIDAADFGGKPGEIKDLVIARPNAEGMGEAISLSPDTAQVSLHGTSLAGIIELAKKLNITLPKMTIIAVQPETIAPSMSLSDACQTAIAAIANKCRTLI